MRRASTLTLACLVLALGCGGSKAPSLPASLPAGDVSFMVKDASTETWSNVGIVIRGASLVAKGDTNAANPVRIYDGSADSTPVDLLQLNAVAQMLSRHANVPPGTYDRLILEVDGNPANIHLVPAMDPVTHVVPAAIDPSQIQVTGTLDTANPAWYVLPTITLSPAAVAAAGAPSAVQLDFNLAHPAFIVPHDTLTTAGVVTLYSVNFGAKGPVRHQPAATLAGYNLRRVLGTVAAVAADGSSVTVTTEHGQSLTLKPDTANSTQFFDLDVLPVKKLAATAIPALLVSGMTMEATVRLRADGTFVATRLWYSASSTLPSLYTREGHLVLVDPVGTTITLLQGKGGPETFLVDAGTKWYFQGDLTQDISAGTGAAFLSSIDRNFKVHLTIANPLVTPQVVAAVDIQRAVFEGSVTRVDTSSFSLSRLFGDGTRSAHTLGYAPAFSFWNFSVPDESSTTLADFVAQGAGTVTGGTGQGLPSYVECTLTWTGGTWAAVNAVFMPLALSPRAQTVTQAYAAGTLQVTPAGLGALPVTVLLDSTSKDKTVVSEYDRKANTLTLSAVDASQWAAKLTAGTLVRVYGVSDGKGNLKAYFVNILR